MNVRVLLYCARLFPHLWSSVAAGTSARASGWAAAIMYAHPTHLVNIRRSRRTLTRAHRTSVKGLMLSNVSVFRGSEVKVLNVLIFALRMVQYTFI